jgi:serine protease Do
MKQCLFRISGLTAIVLLMQFTSFGQDEVDSAKVKYKRFKDNEEIIIKHKSDKNSKITIEINDGQVTVNGKPIQDFEDENFSVRKGRNDFEDMDNITFTAPKIVTSPFRGGGWNYSGDGLNRFYMDSKGAYLGVVTESAEGGGTKITQIIQKSSAEKNGLKLGDVITRIGDSKVDSHMDLVEAIRRHKPMDKVIVTIKREGKELKLPVTLGKSNSSNYVFRYNNSLPKVMEFSGDMPFGLMDMDHPRLGIKAQDTEDGKGVKVLDVDDESPADKAGIKEGDIITQFEGKEVNSAETLSNLAKENKAKYELKVKLLRDGKPQDVQIKMPRKLKTTEL